MKTRILLTGLALLLSTGLAAAALGESTCVVAISDLAGMSIAPYRLPSEADVSEYWAFYREEYGADAFCVRGDLNGDGVSDVAVLAVRDDGPGFALWAFLSQGDRGRRPELLLEDSGGAFRAQDGRIEFLARGSFHRWWGCQGGDVSPIEIESADNGSALDYFSRVPASRSGKARQKHEHFVFQWPTDGRAAVRRDLCTPDEWSRLLSAGY